MRNKGVLFVISGPSGVGKGTIVKELLKRDESIVVSISATTRQPRETDVDGKDYFFITDEKFKSMIENGEFLEYAEYVSSSYGTPKATVLSWLYEGKTVILEIETVGAFQIREKMPEAKLLFIMPPSIEVLVKRLTHADTGTRDNIDDRIQKALDEIKKAPSYDYIVVNDDLERAVEETYKIIESVRKDYGSDDN
ncbi:MAG: guanylate kinase [Clostridia bacterium]|nr:guanylate kinase [Clostridia bacterium]